VRYAPDRFRDFCRSEETHRQPAAQSKPQPHVTFRRIAASGETAQYVAPKLKETPYRPRLGRSPNGKRGIANPVIVL
jgi:hypothetical protein